jgi:hypothetical protein
VPTIHIIPPEIRKSRKLVWVVLILIFILGQQYRAFLSHKQRAVDGDLAAIVVPADIYAPVLRDPFGINLIRTGEPHAAPNRYFAHRIIQIYYHTVPIWLQKNFEPVDSLYVSNALAKTIIQLLLLTLLSYAAYGLFRGDLVQLVYFAAILTPLFQTYGYNRQMGIIDPAITYTFFYALGMGFTLLLFGGIFKDPYKKISIRQTVFIVVGSLMVVLHGPLNAPVVLIFALLIYAANFLQVFHEKELPDGKKKSVFALWLLPLHNHKWIIPVCLAAVYSLWLGTFNTENTDVSVSMMERYLRLPSGLWKIFADKPGWMLVTAVLMYGYVLIFRQRNDSVFARKILQVYKWVGLFCLLYLLLLPLGGYREYREWIVRRDTILPVILCVFFLYSITVYFIFRYIKGIPGHIGRLVAAGVALVFILVDKPVDTGKYLCEYEAIQSISKAAGSRVSLYCDCPVLSWVPIYHAEHSGVNADLLYRLGITDTIRLYYCTAPEDKQE